MAGWWDRLVVPRLIRCACGQAEIMKLRHKVVPQARGAVFELGCGGGINQPLYDATAVTAFAGIDPVEKGPSYYGSQLSFTARIEPVTPPGMIFVTEAFAARLALEVPERFACEYAGEVELAKHFGKYRLFSLQSSERRRGARLQLAGGRDTGRAA
mgnify:CR=1 FL=1